jgi:hypothetical protein
MPPRGYTTAEADARYIPGLKSPIDLPDDFGTNDEGAADYRTITIAAAILLAVAVLAGVLLLVGRP